MDGLAGNEVGKRILDAGERSTATQNATAQIEDTGTTRYPDSVVRRPVSVLPPRFPFDTWMVWRGTRLENGFRTPVSGVRRPRMQQRRSKTPEPRVIRTPLSGVRFLFSYLVSRPTHGWSGGERGWKTDSGRR